jgi:hypothetical protein
MTGMSEILPIMMATLLIFLFYLFQVSGFKLRVEAKTEKLFYVKDVLLIYKLKMQLLKAAGYKMLSKL